MSRAYGWNAQLLIAEENEYGVPILPSLKTIRPEEGILTGSEILRLTSASGNAESLSNRACKTCSRLLTPILQN